MTLTHSERKFGFFFFFWQTISDYTIRTPLSKWSGFASIFNRILWKFWHILCGQITFFWAKGTYHAQKRHRKLRSSDDIAFDRTGVTDRELKVTEDNIIYFWSRKMSVDCHFRLRTYYIIYYSWIYISEEYTFFCILTKTSPWR